MAARNRLKSRGVRRSRSWPGWIGATDLTLIRRARQPLDSGKLLGFQGFGGWIAGVRGCGCRVLAGPLDTS